MVAWTIRATGGKESFASELSSEMLKLGIKRGEEADTTELVVSV
jgi:hypothetical protein